MLTPAPIDLFLDQMVVRGSIDIVAVLGNVYKLDVYSVDGSMLTCGSIRVWCLVHVD